jgi:branched-chain amino acid transport system substrate-binding protein
MNNRLPIGILFSTHGPYATVGKAMHDGAVLALEEINGSQRFPFQIEPIFHDPAGEPSAYGVYANDLLRNKGVKHVIGCYTSSSRKEIIPLFEKHDALLWYPSHYEGFETNQNVIYTGAVQNQHILPLLDYALENIAKDIYFVGSNYIWAWENGRIVRELAGYKGGKVVAERYLKVGDVDVDMIIDEIKKKRPAFIVNMLIGESSYAFYRAFAKARSETNELRSSIIGSCTLCEPELFRIGAGACGGHLTSSVYFSTIDSFENKKFVKSFRKKFGEKAAPSADAEASYNTVYMLANSYHGAGSADIDYIKSALYGTSFRAPQGEIKVNPENNHSYLTVRLGISREDKTFDIIYESGEPVQPDPYLSWSEISNTQEKHAGSYQAHGLRLRVVK